MQQNEDSFDNIFGSSESSNVDDIFSFEDNPDDELLQFVNDALKLETGKGLKSFYGLYALHVTKTKQMRQTVSLVMKYKGDMVWRNQSAQTLMTFSAMIVTVEAAT